jgi:hypothetical protein
MLEAWYGEVETAEWSNTADVKRHYVWQTSRGKLGVPSEGTALSVRIGATSSGGLVLSVVEGLPHDQEANNQRDRHKSERQKFDHARFTDLRQVTHCLPTSRNKMGRAFAARPTY